MNILFTWPIPFNPSIGGVERVTDILAREFARRGHQIFYLHTKNFEGVPTYDYDVKVDFCPIKDSNSKINHEFYKEYLLENKIDIIINQAGAFEESKLFGDVDGTRQVCFHVIHCNPQFYYPYFFKQISYLRNNSVKEHIKRFGRICFYLRLKQDYFNRIKKHYKYLLGSQSKNIVLLSDQYRQELHEIAPDYPEEYINAIGNPTLSAPIKSYKKDNKTILFVGRMENENKHPDRVIKIWRKIYKTFPDWKLVMLGDGPVQKKIEKAAKNLPRIEFKGFTDPIDFYQMADILLLTSNYEGLPMVLIESMSLGCVPISFDSFSSVRDLIKDDRQLVTPFSIKEYTQKLTRLMHDNTLINQLRADGYSIVRGFSAENIADKWENLFKTQLKIIGK